MFRSSLYVADGKCVPTIIVWAVFWHSVVGDHLEAPSPFSFTLSCCERISAADICSINTHGINLRKQMAEFVKLRAWMLQYIS